METGSRDVTELAAANVAPVCPERDDSGSSWWCSSGGSDDGGSWSAAWMMARLAGAVLFS
jgi:hypothetical protein